MRINSIIEKKFRTTYIGAIYAIEKAFNVKWDKAKQVYVEGEEIKKEDWDGEFTGQLTPELLNLFGEIRDEILDIGNNQCRNLKNELDEYFEFTPRIYHTEFRIMEQ